MHYTIYKIVNKINGKTYIGKHQTKDLNDGYMGSGKLLHRAYQKYGVENFSKEILHVYNNEDEMNAKEKELVTEEFCFREDTYNICVGGKGGFSYINREGLNLYGNNSSNYYSFIMKGVKAKQEKLLDINYKNSISNKISISVKNAYIEGRKKSYQPLADHKIREKHALACRNNSKGEKNSQFGSMWITNGTENKKIKNIDIIPEGWYKGRKIKF